MHVENSRCCQMPTWDQQMPQPNEISSAHCEFLHPSAKHQTLQLLSKTLSRYQVKHASQRGQNENIVQSNLWAGHRWQILGKQSIGHTSGNEKEKAVAGNGPQGEA